MYRTSFFCIVLWYVKVLYCHHIRKYCFYKRKYNNLNLFSKKNYSWKIAQIFSNVLSCWHLWVQRISIIKNFSREDDYKSSHRRCSRKFRKNRSLFFNKVVTKTLLQKHIPTEMFPYEFCELLKGIFFTEHFRATASVTNLTCGRFLAS